MANDTPSLADRLSALRAVKVPLSADDTAEIAVRDLIAVEESRIAAERAKKRRLDNARIFDAAKRKVGDDRLIELVDLGDEAGVYVIGNPPPMVGEAFQDAIRDKGNASSLDVANFVIGCMVYPDPNASGVEARDRFDDFPFAAQSLSNVGLRLGGLMVEVRAKK